MKFLFYAGFLIDFRFIWIVSLRLLYFCRILASSNSCSAPLLNIDFAIVTLYLISIQRFLNQFCELQSGYFIPVLESSRCSFRLLLFRLRRLAIKNNCPFAAFCWTFPMPAILPVLTRFFANITINGEREETAHPAIQCVECWTLNKWYVIMTEGGKGRVLNRGFFFQIVKKMPQALVDQHFIIFY